MRVFRPRKSLMTTNDNDNDNIILRAQETNTYLLEKKSKKGSENSKTAKVMLYLCSVKIEAEFLRPS